MYASMPIMEVYASVLDPSQSTSGLYAEEKERERVPSAVVAAAA